MLWTIHRLDRLMFGIFVPRNIVMRTILTLAALFILSCLSHAQAPHELDPDQKGSWLFHACQANVRTMDASNGGTDADLALSDHCLDYTEGYIDGSLGVAPRSYCLGDARLGTMIRVYVNYMQQHPKFLDRPKSVGLLRAWVENYPCQKK